MSVQLRFLVLISSVLCNVICHEVCLDGNFPGTIPQLPPRYYREFKLCKEYEKYGCCDADREEQVIEEYKSHISTHVLSEECGQLIGKVFCQKCSPKSAHLYENHSIHARKYPRLCREFCVNLTSACGDIISSIFGEKICDPLVEDTTEYCYPKTKAVADDQDVKYGQTEDPDCVPVCAQKITSDTEKFLDSAYPPNSVGRLFIVQQDGIIWEFHNGKKFEEPFLDYRERIVPPWAADEQGLLSMVFHPEFERNNFIYLFCVPKVVGVGPIESHVIRLTVSEIGPPMKFDPKSEKIILKFECPAFSHIGGQLFFGNDGFLYITTGDGGGSFDKHGEHGNGQSLTTLHGKILRIDINTENGYEIPQDNPYANSKGQERKEIYAYGFRNPWRASIDRETGRIFVGDVGQDYTEEINIVENGGNYGWRAYEGDKCFDKELCKMINETGGVVKTPFYSLKHYGKGSAVIGGYVYRNAKIKQLRGRYLFGEHHGGYLYALEENGDSLTRRNICVGKLPCPSGTEGVQPWKRLFAFGKDENDEIYVFVGEAASIGQVDGAMYKLVEPEKKP